MAEINEKFDVLLNKYPEGGTMEPEMLDTQLEGEIKYNEEELEAIIAELQQINDDTTEDLKAAESYVATIYDNGNLDATSQEILTEVRNDIAGQSLGIGESLNGLKDFLSNVKTRFADAEVQVKAKLQGWLDKFKGGNKYPTGIKPSPIQPDGPVPNKNLNPVQAIKDYKEKRDELDRLNAIDPTPVVEISDDGTTLTIDNSAAREKREGIARVEASMTPTEKKLYDVHQNIEEGKQQFEKSVEGLKNYNPFERINSYNEKKDALDKLYGQGLHSVEDEEKIMNTMTPAERNAYNIHRNLQSLNPFKK